jgi:hypothetical protein
VSHFFSRIISKKKKFSHKNLPKIALEGVQRDSVLYLS